MAGNPIGTTVVTRESAWDDTERGQALGLAAWDEGMCNCGCGLPRAQAHSPEQAWLIDTEKCYATRAIDRRKRADREKAEQRGLEDWDSGIHYFAVPISDDEAQERRRRPEPRR